MHLIVASYLANWTVSIELKSTEIILGAALVSNELPKYQDAMILSPWWERDYSRGKHFKSALKRAIRGTIRRNGWCLIYIPWLSAPPKSSLSFFFRKTWGGDSCHGIYIYIYIWFHLCYPKLLRTYTVHKWPYIQRILFF